MNIWVVTSDGLDPFYARSLKGAYDYMTEQYGGEVCFPVVGKAFSEEFDRWGFYWRDSTESVFEMTMTRERVW